MLLFTYMFPCIWSGPYSFSGNQAHLQLFYFTQKFFLKYLVVTFKQFQEVQGESTEILPNMYWLRISAKK